jgi:serine/threonine-protein kinase RsbW
VSARAASARPGALRVGATVLGTVRLAGRTAELSRLRRAVEAWAGTCGLPEAAARRLVQATDEAAANAIEHGMSDPAHGRIVVSGRHDAEGLTVHVRYRGPRFDPTTAPAPGPAEILRARAPHGYGLLLIRRLVAQVGYAYRRGVNEVRLTARRDG